MSRYLIKSTQTGEEIIRFTKIIQDVVTFLLFLILFFGGWGTIKAGERGILLKFGAVQDKIFNEGLYFKVPFVQKVTKMDVRIQKDEVETGAASKDLQIVTTTIALNYHLEPERVNKLWQEVGKDYDARIIDPAIQEAVKASTATFTAEELITKREVVKEDIKNNIIERLQGRSIIVDAVNIVNFQFSEEFDNAIELKVTAEQLKLKAEMDLQRIKVEAEQRVAEAEGKARAIQTEARALMENPQVVELRYIEKWNGVMPIYWGGASMFVGLPQK